MRIGPVFLSCVLFLVILIGYGSGGTDFVPGLPSYSPVFAHLLPVSVEDLKRSEKYLRNDLGLEESPSNPTEPLWIRSFKAHPFLVFFSGILFIGGIVAFIIIFKMQNKTIKEGLEKIREHESEIGGGFPGLSTPPQHFQESIAREENEFKNFPSVPPEKALRKVDNVLDTLRHALGTGMRSSRLSLFRYDETGGQFRICGYSLGEEFSHLSPAAFPPKEVFGLPLRILSSFKEERENSAEVMGWCFPFVSESGEYCLLLLEMAAGQPPDNWSEYIQGSMHLIKSLIGRQENIREDASLMTRDSFGALDYRATMNRLLEEWGRTEKLGIPFSVIAIRVSNLEEVEKYYGITPMEIAWTRLTESLQSTLRPTDWIMRPQKDLLMVQVLEAGPVEGRAVMNRISKILSRFGQSQKLEKGLQYKGIIISHPPGSSSTITVFLEQILRRLDQKSDFEGIFFYT